MSSTTISAQDHAAFEAYAFRAIALIEKRQLMGEQEDSPMTEEILGMHLELIKIMNGVFNKTKMKRREEWLRRFGYRMVQGLIAHGAVYLVIKVLPDHGYRRAFCR